MKRMKPKLIALYSPVPQSGKSTIAKRLRDAHGYAIVSFASPVKRTAEAFLRACGMDPEESIRRIYDAKDEAFELVSGLWTSGRRLLQTLGTEWGRRCVMDRLWIEIALARAAKLPLVVIDDMRFANEFLAVKEAGGICVEIIRPGYPAPAVHASHESNGGLEGWQFDYTLSLAEGLDAMHAAADSLVKGDT